MAGSTPRRPARKQRHDEAGGLPHGGDHQAVDDPLRVHQPVEAETFPAPVAEQLVQAQARIEQPLPGGAGDDHRQRHGIQVEGADEAFAADALVQQHCEEHSEHQADGDERAAEEQQVLARHPPAVVVPQALVLAEPGPLVAGHEARVGEGQQQRPANVAIHAEQHHDHAWRQHQLRQPALQAIEWRDATRRYRSRGIDRGIGRHAFSRVRRNPPVPLGGTEPVGRIERSPGRDPRQGLTAPPPRWRPPVAGRPSADPRRGR